jgi:hypothetical protein
MHEYCEYLFQLIDPRFDVRHVLRLDFGGGGVRHTEARASEGRLKGRLVILNVHRMFTECSLNVH